MWQQGLSFWWKEDFRWWVWDILQNLKNSKNQSRPRHQKPEYRIFFQPEKKQKSSIEVWPSFWSCFESNGNAAVVTVKAYSDNNAFWKSSHPVKAMRSLQQHLTQATATYRATCILPSLHSPAGARGWLSAREMEMITRNLVQFKNLKNTSDGEVLCKHLAPSPGSPASAT